ncbi:rRNA-processing protein EFG1-like [Iris pallida]|uniref:rRNA-processing protein EFG1 n=1 Tax=Iris pallida TaxID=29817 RepID=A0AAX6H5N4_IRIPA|nr:rRNA-processing protein EFG1-like [Iris pallida]KAJ6835907.1 rRNA-processing protein EFG1-like [Iris pallida]
MAHGGYAGRRVEGRSSISRRSKGPGVDQRKGKKKAKSVSVKNQIRSTERMLLRKNLPVEVREAQLKKLEELKQFQELQTRLATEHKVQMRDRKIKFFERRKIERMIRRLEKQQRTSSDHTLEGKISHQLSLLREDLEYVRFFPKSEKYVPLFVGGDNPDSIEKRNKLREQIKADRIATAASGKDLEETASDDDVVDMSEDDFFLTGSSSDEAEADDEWTDKSAREPASSASGKATSGMSSDEKNQRQMSARVLMPPPRPLPLSRNRSIGTSTSSYTSHSRSGTSSRNSRQLIETSTSSYTSNSRSGTSSRNSWQSMNSHTDHNSNLSSNSDAHKPRRKRRPKKKKQA